jgi:hypothetical protein
VNNTAGSSELDWATDSHEICVLDTGGRTIGRRTVEHTGAGIAEFIGYLKEVLRVNLGPWQLVPRHRAASSLSR